jgi:hypothetical protein
MTKPAAGPSNPSLEEFEEEKFSRCGGKPRFCEKDVILEGTN